MPGEKQQKFEAQQERIHKLVESNEAKDLADLYVDRIASLKTAIMNAEIPDSQKEVYFERLDSYLRLVDADNMQRLKQSYEPLFRSMELSLNVHAKEQAGDDRDAKLEDVRDPDIRKELLDKWREASKLKKRFDSKKDQIKLLIETKHLKSEGTELEWYTTSIEFYSDFIDSKFVDYIENSDVGKKRESLKAINEQGDQYFEVLSALENRLNQVGKQEDLAVIDLNARSVLAEQKMLVRRRHYEGLKRKFLQHLDDLHVPENAVVRQEAVLIFESADTQFDSYQDLAMQAKNREERAAYAEQANTILDNANAAIEAEQKRLQAEDFKTSYLLNGGRLARNAEPLSKVPGLKFLPQILFPQFAVGLGYYEAMHKGETKTDKVLEVADFGISLVPFAGGLWDIAFAINGRTISGREMGGIERVARGTIGLGSFVLDVFSFGVGGTLVRAGGEAAIKAGVKLTAEATAKAALESSAKFTAKEGVKIGEEALVKAAVEGGAKTAEAGAKAGEVATRAAETGTRAGEVGAKIGEVAAKTGEAGAESASKQAIMVALTDAQKKVIFEGTKAGASKAAREEAKEVFKAAIKESTEAYARTLAKEQAEAVVKYTAKVTQETANIAVRQSGRINRFVTSVTAGAFRSGGMKGLEEGIVKTGTQKAAMEAALKEGKEVGLGYYVRSEFVKEGEVLWGEMAQQVGKDSMKAFWHLHNPMEILKVLETPGRFLKTLFRRFVKGAPSNLFLSKENLVALEEAAKASLIADGHNVKDVERLFSDAKEKPWEQFLKEHEKNTILDDPDAREFFKSFQEQFPKSGVVDVKIQSYVPKIAQGEQAKAMTDIYQTLRAKGVDRTTAVVMLYDSRRMTWEDFMKKYTGKFVEADLKPLESQFKNLHSMDRAMPANYPRIRKEREVFADAVKTSEAELNKLRGSLKDLQQEKSDLESVMKSYSEALERLNKDKKTLTDNEKEKILYDLFEKLPEGNLKRSIQEDRQQGLNLDPEIKEGSDAFKSITSASFQRIVEKRVKEIEGDIAQIAKDLEAAAVARTGMKEPGVPHKLDQKEASK